MTRVKIIGAGGYGGIGTIELLSRHPGVEIVSLVAISEYGEPISHYYPHLRGVCDLPVRHPNEDDTDADVIFFSTPDRVGMAQAKQYADAGKKIIDFSGDFRFQNPETYAEYARRIGKPEHHEAESLLPKSAYGLPEINRQHIRDAQIVGNPGCFAVSAILGARPAVEANLVDAHTLIFDAKTGISGAGKKVNPAYHYPHRYEEMNAYKVGKHQHVMEVEHTLSLSAGADIPVTFTTQVVPLVRGIMTTVYADVRDGVSYEQILEAYREAYADEPFVRVLDETKQAGNRHVRGTNNAVVWIHLERRTNRLIVVSHIDNLLKGQAGNAVQNLNIIAGFPETEGLTGIANYP